jgi:hypothetical protein
MSTFEIAAGTSTPDDPTALELYAWNAQVAAAWGDPGGQLFYRFSGFGGSDFALRRVIVSVHSRSTVISTRRTRSGPDSRRTTSGAGGSGSGNSGGFFLRENNHMQVSAIGFEYDPH